MRPDPQNPRPVADAGTRLPASGRPLSIVILAGDADANLGDRAILQAMVHEFHSSRSDLKLYAVGSPLPAGGVAGVQFIPRGPRGFVALCRAMVRSDLVVCGGGGLFQDDDSLIKMPYWCLRVLLAKLLCGRVVGYSLGVGPLQALTSRVTARVAFAVMEQISARDPLAQQEASALTSRPVLLVPDPALLLESVPAQTARDWLATRGVPLDGRPLIGVALRRWFPPARRLLPNKVRSRFAVRPEDLSEGSERLASMLGSVLDELVRRHRAHVLLLPSYCVAHEGDAAMARAVIRSMNERSVQLLQIDDPALYKGVTATLALLLGGRMHPTIFAAAAGTPVVGLAYNPKFRGFFDLLNLGERVMDVVDFVQQERVADLVTLASDALNGAPIPHSQVAGPALLCRSYSRALLGAMP